ncbi:hypothetical protein SACC_32820 [Saccharolobus caldissimus]|uniref:Uncharacterized protein n=1 Tax=Saccharolobus caldissimus TaxID=1702097 RepID=A0AAQ4CWT4_9CREN|nr:hypothetical protein SACC_32820 [Saccharolobus caldissimus]
MLLAHKGVRGVSKNRIERRSRESYGGNVERGRRKRISTT